MKIYLDLNQTGMEDDTFYRAPLRVVEVKKGDKKNDRNQK